jgi:copper(I)-binding protein
MKKILYLLLVTGSICSSEAHAMIKVKNASISAAPQGGTAILSMSIQNTADTPDNLIQVKASPLQPPISQGVILQNKEANGNMKTDPIQIPANGDVTLGPTTNHVSLTGLKKALTPGDITDLQTALAKKVPADITKVLEKGHAVQLILHFQYAGDVTLNVAVK